MFDQGIIHDDTLGMASIDLQKSIEAPVTWAIDDLFPLEDPEKKANTQQVYLQVYWVPEGT